MWAWLEWVSSEVDLPQKEKNKYPHMFREDEKFLELEPTLYKQKSGGFIEKGSVNYNKETPSL